MPDISLSAGVDTSGVSTGLSAIKNEVARTGQSIATSFAGVFSPSGLISAAITGFIAGGFKQLLDKAREIHHEAERFNIDAESLQKIGNAAKEDGISLESTARALNQLTINAQAGLNPTSKQAQALKELGINAAEFAKLKPDEQFLRLADAYAFSAKSGADYANVATLIGKKNTELIPILAKGAAAIKEQSDGMGAWSNAAVANLAKVSKDFERGTSQITAVVVNSIAWLQKWEDKIEEVAQKAHNLLFNTPDQALPPQFQPGGGSFGGHGAGSDFGGQLKEQLDLSEQLQATLEKENEARVAGLSSEERLTELYNERINLQNQLAQQIETEGDYTERALELRGDIADVTKEIIPLENQVADAAEREALAQQRAADEVARKADEEKRAAEEARKAEQLRQQGPNPLTVNALAENNLRLGATSDVYAQALAASRGIQPGTPEYERLLQQIEAEDRLRELQGRNLSFADQLNRDKLVQWFAKAQQDKASGAADQSHRDEIAFWEAIAAGRSPGNNPYTNIFGNSPFTSANIIPGQGNSAPIAQLSTQIDLLGQAVTSLQQIQKNTTLVRI